MIAQIKSDVVQGFRSRFGGSPRVFAAPGRINIIGEHTDYSEGLVMPAAIDRFCLTAMAKNGSDTMRVLALGRQEKPRSRRVLPGPGHGWTMSQVSGNHFVTQELTFPAAIW